MRRRTLALLGFGVLTVTAVAVLGTALAARTETEAGHPRPLVGRSPHRGRSRRHSARGRHRHRQSNQAKDTDCAQALEAAPPLAGRRSRQLAAGLLVGLLGFGLFSAVSWTRPTTTAGPVDYTHHGEFTYTATAVTGPVYDSPRVHTGQPLFLALIDGLRVGFSYRMTVDEPAVVRGTIALDARVDNRTGWTRTLQLAAPQLFEGHQARVAGGLDIGRIRSLVAEAAEATGEAGVTTITLHPRVTLDGELGYH